MRRADNLTTFMCRLSWNQGASTSWNPQGLSRAVMGLLYVKGRKRRFESSWNVMAHGDAREVKWRGNCRMEWVASTLHTTTEHGVSSITSADAHNSAASSRLNWRPRRFKWTRPFRRKTKSGFWTCAITFQTQSTNVAKDLMKAGRPDTLWARASYVGR